MKLDLSQFDGATPGPWRASPYYCTKRKMDVPGRYQCISLPIPGQELGSRGFVLGVGLKGEVDDYWIRVNDADARLIAAAPSLLAACLEMKQALEDLLDDMGNDGLCVCPAAKEQAIQALSRFKDKDNG